MASGGSRSAQPNVKWEPFLPSTTNRWNPLWHRQDPARHPQYPQHPSGLHNYGFHFYICQTKLRRFQRVEWSSIQLHEKAIWLIPDLDAAALSAKSLSMPTRTPPLHPTSTPSIATSWRRSALRPKSPSTATLRHAKTHWASKRRIHDRAVNARRFSTSSQL